ncbi:MAG: hypothetical protein ABI445_13110 [Polyangia bacterium]
MSDYVNINAPRASKLHSRTGIMLDALAQFGAVVVSSGALGHANMATTTTAGDPLVAGVVTSQGDPNNSGLFAIGDEVSVTDLGDVLVLVAGGTTLARGDRLIAAATPGLAKKLAAETNVCVLGESLQDVTTGALPQLVSCRLQLQRAVP